MYLIVYTYIQRDCISIAFWGGYINCYEDAIGFMVAFPTQDVTTEHARIPSVLLKDVTSNRVPNVSTVLKQAMEQSVCAKFAFTF